MKRDQGLKTLHWSLRYPLQKQPRAGSAATSQIGFHVKCFLHFLKIFIAQMGTFDIWKNPRMSKVQHGLMTNVISIAGILVDTAECSYNGF
jgi:hypothetical protein